MARTLSQSQAYIEELVEVEGHGENFLKEFGAGVLGVAKDTVHFFGTLLSEAVHGEWWDLIKDAVIAVAIGVVIALVVGFGGWIGALAILAFVAFDFYSSLRSGKSLGYALGHGLTLGGLFIFGGELAASEEGVEEAVAAGRAGTESVERAETGEVTKGQKSENEAIEKIPPSMEVRQQTLAEMKPNVQEAIEYHNEHGNFKSEPGKSLNKDFENKDGQLPKKDSNGNDLLYKENDVNKRGPNGRDAERIVIGSDGKVYFTNTHYGAEGRSPAFVEIVDTELDTTKIKFKQGEK